MSDSVRPHRRQPTRLPQPWDAPGKSTGVGWHFLLQCMQVKSESEIAQSCPTLSNPMDRSQAPPSMGFSRQEYWSGLPLPSLICIDTLNFLSFIFFHFIHSTHHHLVYYVLFVCTHVYTIPSRIEIPWDWELWQSPNLGECFPGGSAAKNPPANAGDLSSVSGSGRSPGEENGNLLQYSCLGNPMDRGVWRATVHGVTKESDTTEATKQQQQNLGEGLAYDTYLLSEWMILIRAHISSCSLSFFPPSISCPEFPLDKSKWLLNDTQLVLQENHCLPPSTLKFLLLLALIWITGTIIKNAVTHDSSFLLTPFSEYQQVLECQPPRHISLSPECMIYTTMVLFHSVS